MRALGRGEEGLGGAGALEVTLPRFLGLNRLLSLARSHSLRSRQPSFSCAGVRRGGAEPVCVGPRGPGRGGLPGAPCHTSPSLLLRPTSTEWIGGRPDGWVNGWILGSIDRLVGVFIDILIGCWVGRTIRRGGFLSRLSLRLSLSRCPAHSCMAIVGRTVRDAPRFPKPTE